MGPLPVRQPWSLAPDLDGRSVVLVGYPSNQSESRVCFFLRRIGFDSARCTAAELAGGTAVWDGGVAVCTHHRHIPRVGRGFGAVGGWVPPTNRQDFGDPNHSGPDFPVLGGVLLCDTVV